MSAFAGRRRPQALSVQARSCSRGRSRTTRPLLEALEDRCLPATAISLASPSLLSDAAGGSSNYATTSADGRFIAFQSNASNLVANESNPNDHTNIYLYDSQTQTITLVSHSTSGAANSANGDSTGPSLSADGRYLVFSSTASDLQSGTAKNDSGSDVFVYDRVAGTLAMVSHQFGGTATTGNGSSDQAVISRDGNFIAYRSLATNLVAGQADTNGATDIFVYDRATTLNVLASGAFGSSFTTPSAGASDSPVISDDGSYVAYRSDATTLVSGEVDTNNASDVYLFNRLTSSTSIVSHASGTNHTTSSGASDQPVINSDGSFVAYRSTSNNLVGSETKSNTSTDIYVYDRSAQTNALVSHTSGSTSTTGNAGSDSAVISGNAASSFVAYRSLASNLSLGLTKGNASSDVFLYTVTGTSSTTNTLVSHTATSPTTSGNAGSDEPALSADSSTVLFRSYATDLVTGLTQGNANGDLYEYDRTTGNLSLVSRNTVSSTNSGNNGSYIGAPQAFPPAPPSPITTANYPSYPPPNPLSGDGGVVAFSSFATDLVAGPLVANGYDNVFRYVRSTMSTGLVSATDPSVPSATAGGDSSPSTALGRSTSSDGRYIAFVSRASNLVAGQTDTNYVNDVFLYDRLLGTVTLVSHSAASTTTAGNNLSTDPTVSNDGNLVTFLSRATDLVSGETVANPGGFNVYVWDRSSGTIALVSRTNGNSTQTANNDSSAAVISGNGSAIAFVSLATDLVAGQTDTNGKADVFVYNLSTGTTTLVSGAASPTATGNGASDTPTISNDGNFVAFRSDATNLVAGEVDTNNASDVYLFNVSAGTSSLISHANGLPLNSSASGSDSPVISGDGTAVAYVSSSNNLVAGQNSTAGVRNVFEYDRLSASNRLVSHQDGSSTTAANGPSTSPVISIDGSFVAYVSLATNLAPSQSDTNNVTDVFLYSRAGDTNILVSHNSGSVNTSANADSTSPLISDDGQKVAYLSQATDLVSGELKVDTGTDVYLFDRQSGANLLVSADSGNPSQTGLAPSANPVLSGDGSTVAFSSHSTDFTPNDRNASADAFFLTVPRAPTDIALSNASVPGFQPAGTTVGTFSTTDPSGGTAFSYALVPGAGSADNGFFTISGNTLQTADVLDPNAQSSYSIRVRTTNASGLSFEKVFTITVTNVNTAPTGLALTNTNVPEKQLAGTAVGTFITTDPNPGDTFTYNLVPGPGSQDNTAFVIKGNQLQTATVFDYNTKSSYNIRVRTTDQGGLFFEQTFTINVLQVPAAPTDISLSNNRIPDESPANTVVGVFSTTSTINGLSFTYSLVPGQGSTDNSSFSINGSTLVTNDLSKASHRAPYSIRVRSTDSNGQSVEKVFTITVGPRPAIQTIGAFNPTTGTWYLRNENNSGAPDAGAFQYGLPGWKPVVGDWDGNSSQTIGIVDPTGLRAPGFAVWYLRNSNSAGLPSITPFAYGLQDWTPVAGDWEGKGTTGIGMVDTGNPIGLNWILRDAPNAGIPDITPFAFGAPGWIPVVGDWDGNGTTTIGAVDPTTETWYLRNSNTPGLPDIVIRYGLPGWIPVVGDWNGDGKTDIGVIDPSALGGPRWYLSTLLPATFVYGAPGWTPLSGDWDFPTMPLLAAGTPTSAPGADLTDAQLASAVSAALARLSSAGVSATVLGELGSASYHVGAVPAGYLGLASPSSHEVWVSPDAAGFGWFAAAGLGSDSAFDSSGKAVAGGPAAGRMDLLSVVLHEMGHLAGRGDDPAGSPDDIMADSLSAGVRRVQALDTIFGSAG